MAYKTMYEKKRYDYLVSYNYITKEGEMLSVGNTKISIKRRLNMRVLKTLTRSIEKSTGAIEVVILSVTSLNRF